MGDSLPQKLSWAREPPTVLPVLLKMKKNKIKNQSRGHRFNQGMSSSYLHSIIISPATSFSIITELPVKVVCNHLQYVSDSGVSSAPMCVCIYSYTHKFWLSYDPSNTAEQFTHLRDWDVSDSINQWRSWKEQILLFCFPFWFRIYRW